MLVTPEEQDWLANNWPRTRRTLNRLIEPLLDAACDDLAASGKISDGNWKTVMDQAMTAIAGRAVESDLHATALTLLADGRLLRATIEETLGGLDHAAAGRLRGRAVARGLTRCRDVMLAGSAHRGKTWSRLDRISREIWQASLASHAWVPGGRCSDEHLLDVLARIREGSPGHSGLPRSLDGLRDYFHAFCPDCQPEEADAAEDWEWTEPDHLALLPDADVRMTFLLLCMELLDEEHLRFARVWSGMDEAGDEGVSAFCAATGISRDRFNREIRKVFKALADCIARREEDVLPLPRVVSAWNEMALFHANDEDDRA